MTAPPADTSPSLPRRALVPLQAWLLGCVWATAAAEPPAATSVYDRRPTAATATAASAEARPAVEDARAERMLSGALAALANAESFSARLRQKARVGDRVLVGTGRYLQLGRGEEQRYRFESTLTCDTETFELVEVCDGVFAWTYRHYGTDTPQLERLDVRRVRERLGQLGVPDPQVTAPYLGGLQRTCAGLRQWFRFASAQPGEVEGLAVWVVDGHWSPDGLAGLMPELAAAARQPGGIAAAELPDGMPWRVRFCIGRSDLVPHRVEWHAIPGPRPAAGGEPEPVAVLELEDVRINGPVDAGAFVYRPAAEGLIDLTEPHVASLTPLRP